MKKNGILKKIISIVLLMAFALSMLSCDKNKGAKQAETKSILNLEENLKNKNVAVVYFSLNDDTKDVAETFKEALDADILEILPEVEYSEDDLDYSNVNSRIYLEDEFNPFEETVIRADEEYETSYGIVIPTKSEVEKKKYLTELPKINSIDVKDYKILVVGFPVWYENAPKVIYTFLKDLKNTTVIPFCTGGEIGMIDQYLSNFVDKSVRVMSGKRFDKSVGVEDVKKWVEQMSADFDIK